MRGCGGMGSQIKGRDIIMVEEDKQLVFKVIVVGESGSGKSCLIQRYLTDEFMDHYNVTLGVEYHTKIVKIDEHLSMKLKIWDTAGQEAFNSIVKSFYRNSHVVVLVYDITRRQTFDNLDVWQMQALQNSPEDVIYVLVGTHLDVPENRQVSQEEAKNWMEEANVQIFFETSAVTAQNVKKMFDEVCSQLLLKSLKRGKNKEEGSSGGFKLTSGESEKHSESSCC